MVELEISGTRIELYQDQSVTYTKRAAEFGQVDKLASSYTNNFKVPKSLDNVKFFEGLGLVGDSSTLPYTYTKANLLDDGVTLVLNGSIKITETNEDYKISLIDGIKDFFDIIRGKTIIENVDLSELDHTKDIHNVLDSWEGTTQYKYIVANYGNPYLGTGSDFGVNANNLVPSVRLSYIFNKIMAFAGYTYSGNFNLTQDWITYPKPVPQQSVNEIDVLLASTAYTGFYDVVNTPDVYKSWDAANPIQGSLITNWRYVIPVTGVIKITTNPEGSITYVSSGGVAIPPQNYRWRILLNNSPINFFWSNQGLQEIEFNANQGDIIDFEIFPETTNEIRARYFFALGNNYTPIELNINNILLNVHFMEEQTVSFVEGFGNLKMEDFFKEIMWRFALVPFADNVNKHIEFLTMDERLSAETVDWTDKYIRRVSERYDFGTYGQSNVFAMKYHGDNTGYKDGSVEITNTNLPTEVNILQSFIFSPLEEQFDMQLTLFGSNQTVWQFPMWEQEVENLADGTIETKYKSLSDRYFIMKYQTVFKTITLVQYNEDTGMYEKTTSFAGFPMAITSNTTYSEIVPNRYSRFNDVLNDVRIHEIELALSASDILNLDMKKLYFFEQEHNRYLLNKITWTKGKVAKGEFLRVKGNTANATIL